MRLKLFTAFLLAVLIVVSSCCVAFAVVDNTSNSDGLIANVVHFVSNFFSNLQAFFVGLFLPSSDYFPNQIGRLNEVVDKKMGGVGYLYSMLKDFFSGLKTKTALKSLMFSIPDNYFFSGYKGFSVDFLSSASTYFKFFRDFLNVVVCLVTGFFCYKKLITMFHS